MAITLAADMAALFLKENVASDLDDMDLLVRQYRPRLLRFVSAQVRDDDLAFSIVQDALLKAHRNRATFRAECTINTWLSGIALNLIRDHARTQKFKFWQKASQSSQDASELSNYLRSGGSSAEQMLIARQQAAVVHAALADLTEKQRAVFAMRFLEEMDIADIADQMEMPVSTVKTHLHRATKAVRARIQGKA